ncbi:uncharacterized protein [Gossypium hirsutum]|uniref:Uncharacterized protein n=1 Tax=Gossypium hirsutum TaxID=3635 RepID=A0A1U8IDA9_GOSHI|nr:uncharacterized protein LOC107895411 [Gossypium hirsutum]
MKKDRDTTKAWKEVHLMELALYADTITQDYDIWRKRQVNSQEVSSTNYTFQNPFLEEMPSELEITRHEFERIRVKLLRDISSLQEENYQLKIDVQIKKSQTVKIQREVEIVRNDLRDLHLENKKLRSTIKNSGLAKSSVEWKEEIRNIIGGMEFWKGKAKKEEEKAARAMIELRKKNAEYETVTAEFVTSQSERQELRRKIQDLENILQSHLDDSLEITRLKMDDHDVQDKYRSLEERHKAIEGTEAFSALSAKEFSLVPDLVLPPKFKVPDFEKYDGTRCLKTHLVMSCWKMTGYVNEDKLLIHCF